MKRLIVSLFIVICALSLSAQQYFFTVDERHPAERPLLSKSRNILVVNNTTPQPRDFGHSNYEDGTLLGSSSVDLKDAVLRCLFATTQTMDDSGEFERVELMDISQNVSRNFYVRTLMTVADEEKLCAEYEADAILILNHLVLYDICESYPVDDDRYYAYLQVCSQTHWTVHYVGSVHDVVFTTADTLYWESPLSYTRAQVLSDLPDRQQALTYMAQQVGVGVATSLTPQWEPVTHYLYDHPDVTIQRGMRAFQRKQWGMAIDIWQAALSSDDKKVRTTAAADMAIAAEMQGDYSSASDYARLAADLFGTWKNADGRQQQINMRHYQEHLRVREAEEVALSAY